ncbi:MAG: hypothetical protein KDD15_21535 [Lewinella sp.]|nr:hypothetical protein [Lewinella sp.]
MNKYRISGLILLLTIFVCSFACTQKTGQMALLPKADSPMPNGAWSREIEDEDKMITEVLLFIDGYYSLTAYESGSGAFSSTKGGSFSKDGMNLKLNQEFHSAGPAELGVTEEWFLQSKDGGLAIQTHNETGSWKPLDVGRQTALTGAWLFSGRERDGEMQRRDTNQARKTMKILTGTRFQWIAYNTDTGEFFGTGGGEYSALEGQYVEKIRFFSRNNDRVGAELPFQFSTEGGEWHHRGKSSSGDPMYEVWARRMK